MTSPERVVVIGCGLIGTSVAMAAVRAGDSVTGIESDPVHARVASERAAIRVSADEGALADATLVVVATPTASASQRVRHALDRARGATVTDVASVKASVVAEVRAALGDDDARSRFVPGHPMGGSERSGPATASPTLLEGATWVLSPDASTEETRVRHVEGWVRRLGALPVRLSAERHDRLVAFVSHLPQVASTALMSLAAEREAGEPDALLLAAGGFRDLTRLAASNPTLWGEILTSNRDEVVGALDAYARAIDALRRSVAAGDRDSIEAAFATGRAARLALTPKARVRSGVAVLLVPIPDRPGALAELTAALRGVNIEDLQIVHSAEGGRGVVHLTVAAEDAVAADAALTAAGATPSRIA